MDLIGCDPEDILLVSAKEGIGVPGAARSGGEARAAAARATWTAPLRALIFDSYYDRYRGAIPSIRVVDGVLKKGMKITFGASDNVYEVAEVGYNCSCARWRRPSSRAGEVGYVVANVRSVKETRAGDTIFDADEPARRRRCPGYQEVRSLRVRRHLPDRHAAVRGRCATRSRSCSSTTPRCSTQPETSTALGFGFRCGFLGLLHMEIVQERLEREFDLDLVTTVPSVEYQVLSRPTATMVLVENPALMPPASMIDYDRGAVREGAHHGARPTTSAPIMTLGTERRGVYKGMTLPRHHARGVRLGVPARRDHPRLLRQAEDRSARLRLARLRDARATARASSCGSTC